MGHYTRVTGEIYAKPPISWKEAKDTEWAKPCTREDELTLEWFEESVPTEIDGDHVLVVKRTFTHVRPTWDDSYKAYDTQKNLQKIVDAFPGHEWEGYLEGEGEGYGDGEPDFWRLYVRDGEVIYVKPELVWPEV